MNRDLWRVSFGNELAKQERKQASKFRAYLKQNYNTAIDQAIERQGMQSLDGLFQEAELKNLYIDLYRTIGTRFALWYQDAYRKLIKKNGDRTTWAETFAGVGEREAGRKIVIVQGTAKKEVQRVLGRLFKDPDFTAQGAEVQGRILRQQFNQISQYQAERIVRTETTNAANQGVMKSATDLFGKNNLQKEWIASLDERTRGTHAAVNGTVVEYDEAFSVGGDLMQHPADPAGRASNVINCRCSIALIPKADAELQEGVELEGFGGVLAARTTRLVGDELVTAAKPTKEVVEEVAEDTRSKFYPKALKDMEKDYPIRDTGYIDLLTEPVELTFNRKGSFAIGNKIEINVKRYPKGVDKVNSVLAHEFGHVIHNQRKWAKYNPLSKKDPIVHPEVKKFFDKWRKDLGMGKRWANQKPIFDEINDRGLEFTAKNISKLEKDFSHLSENQRLEFHGSMADFFGALTKNKLGYGHSTSYYTRRGSYGQYAEMLAHCFENYYIGNPVFKKYYPEFYKESIELMQKLIDSIE